MPEVEGRYRLVAEVRHDKGPKRPCYAGLYCGRQTFPGGPADIHQLAAVTFDDTQAKADNPMRLVKEIEYQRQGKAPPPPPPNRPRLELEITAVDTRNPKVAWGHDLAVADGFIWSGEGHTGWRSVEITVSPGGIVVKWDGREFGATAGTIRGTAAEGGRTLRSAHTSEPFVQGVWPDYTPGGGLGLYIRRGSASFRSVSITRMQETD